MERFPDDGAFEVDLDEQKISIGHKQQGELRMALTEGRLSSNKRKNEKDNRFCSKFLKIQVSL